ncbi:MAG: HD-GYP domain-containing protein [Eubacteriales bacterium]|nr:HD-GYP domain-containing protein [Eubacteriales bacterium]
MKRATQIYLFFIISAGLAILAYYTLSDIQHMIQILAGVLFMALLGAVAESQSVAIDESKAISIAVAINLSALLIYGAAGAAWVAFATAFFSVMDYGRGHKEHLFNTPIYKSLFNSSNYILSISAAAMTYNSLGGRVLFGIESGSLSNSLQLITHHAPAIVVSLLVYVTVNTLVLVALLTIESDKDRQVLHDWLGIFRWSLLSMFAIGSLGVLLTAVYHSYGVIVVLLLFAPFMLLRYVYVGFSSIKKGYIDTINAFSSALEAKDEYTNGHSQRVSRYCAWICEELNLSRDRTRSLHYASLLHDIGKIGIPESILNKRERLTEEEMMSVRRHPEIGAQMLGNIAFLQREVRMIRAHHVHYDGSGYPDNALEDSRLLETQILCVADSFDAMTSDRAYRSAMPLELAIDEMRRCSGTQFSPEVVDALIRAIRRRQQQGKLEALPA